jgi:hypothetical protein
VRLQEKGGEIGCDIRFITRKAQEDFLAVGDDGQTPGATGSLVLPEDIVRFTPPYLGFSGDLLHEVRKQFTQPLAACYVAVRHYLRSTWIKEINGALLSVAAHIELERQSVRLNPDAASFQQLEDLDWFEEA